MNTEIGYCVTTSSVNTLRSKGFTADFELDGCHLICKGKKIDMAELKIIVVFRCEGNTDTTGITTVYGLETNNGLKGILITREGLHPGAPHEVLNGLHLKLLTHGNTDGKMHTKDYLPKA